MGGFRPELGCLGLVNEGMVRSTVLSFDLIKLGSVNPVLGWTSSVWADDGLNSWVWSQMGSVNLIWVGPV